MPGNPARTMTPPPARRSTLALRPEHQSTAETSLRSRRTIDEVMRRTRVPFSKPPHRLSPRELEELETSLRELEEQLLQRERKVQETESRHVEWERNLAEAEALMQAKEHILEARARKLQSRLLASASSKPPLNPPEAPPTQHATASPDQPLPRETTPGEDALRDPSDDTSHHDETEALNRLRAELEAQEAALKEQKAALKEREQFIENAENTLFEKTMEQQEREAYIEQRLEELRSLETQAGLAPEDDPAAEAE